MQHLEGRSSGLISLLLWLAGTLLPTQFFCVLPGNIPIIRVPSSLQVKTEHRTVNIPFTWRKQGSSRPTLWLFWEGLQRIWTADGEIKASPVVCLLFTSECIVSAYNCFCWLPPPVCHYSSCVLYSYWWVPSTKSQFIFFIRDTLWWTMLAREISKMRMVPLEITYFLPPGIVGRKVVNCHSILLFFR